MYINIQIARLTHWICYKLNYDGCEVIKFMLKYNYVFILEGAHTPVARTRCISIRHA